MHPYFCNGSLVDITMQFIKEPCGLDKMHMTMAKIDERQKLDG